MKILALDTSSQAASCALLEDERPIGSFYIDAKLTHSQTIMTMAEDLLNTCGLTAQDVEAVAVAAGPGSFTGVRIGVAAAKGFAWGAELPCCGVSTLEAMAESLGVYEGYVCACMDARRNQVYNGLFRAVGGKLERVSEDRAIALADLKEELKNYDKPVFLVGDGANLCYNTLSKEVSNLVLPPEHRIHQRAVGVALLAAKQAALGAAPGGAELTPNYLRLSQAERERLQKEEKTI